MGFMITHCTQASMVLLLRLSKTSFWGPYYHRDDANKRFTKPEPSTLELQSHYAESHHEKEKPRFEFSEGQKGFKLETIIIMWGQACKSFRVILDEKIIRWKANGDSN